jgi:thermostable 8-oxoguanine DNA glycosylase
MIKMKYVIKKHKQIHDIKYIINSDMLRRVTHNILYNIKNIIYKIVYLH